MTTTSALPPTWEVPKPFRQRVGETVGGQRAMTAEGHLLLILHAPPHREDDRRAGRFFWREPSGEWHSSNHGHGQKALIKHLDEYAELITRYDEFDESFQRAEEHFVVLQALSPIQRAARHMHRVLQDARQMCPEFPELINFRDRAYQIERMVELAYDEAKRGLDYSIARRTEEQARNSYRMAVSAHRLNILAAFFFPLATLSALFGMNLAHGLENAWQPWPMVILIAVGLITGLWLQRFVREDTPAGQLTPDDSERRAAQKLRQVK